MRRLVLAAALALAGCASTEVTLLEGEAGADAGAVVVLDPKSEADAGLIDKANTRAAAGARAKTGRAANLKRYANLTGYVPYAPRRYVLYFLEGSTTMAPGSDEVFAAAMRDLKSQPGAEVVVTGHTDTVGKDVDNDALSLDRAQQIVKALLLLGLNEDVTHAVGRGERDLLVPTGDGVEEPRNRRVEITVR